MADEEKKEEGKEEAKPAAEGQEATGKEAEVQAAELPPLKPGAQGAPNVKLAPLMGVNLKISVILGETVMPMGELLKLGTGSVIELNTSTGEAIQVFVNDRLFAKGEIVVVDESFGIRIVEIMDAPKVDVP